MKSETYGALRKDLQRIQKTLVASQVDAVRRDPALSARMQRLHAEAEVGGHIDEFVGLAARRSTVLFLLRTVFVRVLEDLGILSLKRIRDEWGFAAFREVAPALGLRAYFAFIFRDLAVDFPALFAPADDELPLPHEDGCRELWNLWHHPNRNGEHYVWNEDGFDSHFLGDLYQDLDADIRKRYALLQTPPFVEEYILDHALTPALAEFDPAALHASGRRFRILDPTCGSGHFLIGAFHRIATYWRDTHTMSELGACERALESVWGCDINPHAVEIAQFRLLLEVVARTGSEDFDLLAALKLNVRAMDSLIPWEKSAKQVELFPAKDRLDAYATPKQRKENATFLGREFHVVVGNPPYIQPKDDRKADDYRAFWPNSCFKEFCLHAPFLERFLVLGAKGAFTGQITANNFAKRTFGKAVITKVLSKWRTTAVIDTSLAPIPGHGWKGGTSTVMLFGRCMPFDPAPIPWVLAKRRENTTFDEPAKSQAWLAIKNADLHADSQGPYVDVQLRDAIQVASFPWDLRGQDGQEVLALMHRASDIPLVSLCEGRIGSDIITRAPEIFEWSLRDGNRLGIPLQLLRPYADGKSIRDWHSDLPDYVLVPYANRTPVVGLERETIERTFWKWRRTLSTRFVSGGVTLRDKGLPFFSIPQVPWHKHASNKVIAFPFVTTEPHFAIVEREAWFKDSVKLIKLRQSETPGEWLSVLGTLNSSTASFWLRGKFKGTGNVRELWEERIQIDEKLGAFPLPRLNENTAGMLASTLNAVGKSRSAYLPGNILESGEWSVTSLASKLATSRERYLALTFQMVALQEELDWIIYCAYHLVDPLPTVGPEAIEPLAPGHRPFEIVLARSDEDAENAEKSSWWSRHSHDRVTAIPVSYSDAHRTRLQHRIDLIESDVRLALVEAPAYKRRWQLPEWASETKQAAESWLLDRLEELFSPATEIIPQGPLAEPKPYRLEDIAIAWARDPRVAAVAGVWTGTGASVDLTLVAERLLRDNALPDNPCRVYSEEGMRNFEEWKRTWLLQDQEDVWEKARAHAELRGEAAPTKRLIDPCDESQALDSIPLPPKFDKHDFSADEFFSLRGTLNVPRERFILFAELSPNRFGWNGWRDRDRALAQVEAFTLAENDPQEPLPLPTSDDPRRCGVTFGLWESLPDVRRWGKTEEHGELQALAREACHQSRCPCPIVEAWKSQVLQGKLTDKALGKAKAKRKDPVTLKHEATVSLASRAWVASLFHVGKEFDTAALWARHRSRLSEPPQSTLPGVNGPPVQLVMAEVNGGPRSEGASLDETQLALVLDDLVASGDLQVRGRGKKKRFQLVPRGVSS